MWRKAVRGEQNPWCDRLRELINEAAEVDAERGGVLRRSVELPTEILDNEEARAAISRAVAGQKPWRPISLGKGEAKALVAAIKVDAAAVRDGDTETWRHVAAVVGNALRQERRMRDGTRSPRKLARRLARTAMRPSSLPVPCCALRRHAPPGAAACFCRCQRLHHRGAFQRPKSLPRTRRPD